MPAGMAGPLPVVVVHFQAPEWCASSAAAMAASSGVDVDVIVVDNSGELAADQRGLPPAATVIPAGTNAGYAGGANLGIRHALATHPDAPYVVVCSHDFHPDAECFSRLVEAADGDPTLGVLAPRLTAPQPSIGWWFDGRRSTNIEPRDDAPAVFESDWVSGTCMLLRSDCLRALGGFDEGFRSYVEDVDMCLRVRDAGRRVATVVAATGHGLGSVSSVRFRMTAINVALLAAKREGARAAWLLVGRYVLRFLRSGLLAALPSTRGLARRAASLRYGAARGGAAWYLIRSRLINVYARTPSRFEPTFGP